LLPMLVLLIVQTTCVTFQRKHDVYHDSLSELSQGNEKICLETIINYTNLVLQAEVLQLQPSKMGCQYCVSVQSVVAIHWK